MRPTITPEEGQLTEWAIQHGLVMRKKDNRGEWQDLVAPLSLYPTSWPHHLFLQAFNIQPTFQRLIYEIVRERSWLDGLCELLYDDFVRSILQIWRACPKQSLRVGFFRSDYMLHEGEGMTELKQVELNTISPSFSYLSQLTARMHREIYRKSMDIPENKAGEEAAAMIRDGLGMFMEYYSCKDACAIMVVLPEEQNYYDQQGILEGSRMSTFRLTFDEIHYRCNIDGQNRLFLDNEKVVGLVFYRAGYIPQHYPNETAWTVRLMVERSTAIKVPDAGLHLAGLKKVQQELTNPNTLARFVPEQRDRDILKSTFMQILTLDDTEEGDRNAMMACQEPSSWIVKPQREGGGHNIYNDELVTFLRTADKRSRAAHILMEKIHASMEENTLIRDQSWTGQTISELGIFGTLMIRDDVIVDNRTAGYLLRTKPADAQEGGVAAGYSCLNSITLLKLN